jgi:hypothetical protein
MLIWRKSPVKRLLAESRQKARGLAASTARDPDAPIANGWLMFYFALVLTVLVFVVGAVDQWREGAGQGSAFGELIWHVTWITYSLLKAAFLILFGIWGYRRFQRWRQRHSP